MTNKNQSAITNTKTQKEIEEYVRKQIMASHRMALKAFQEQGHYEHYNGYESDEIKFILSLLSSHAEQVRAEERERIFSVIKPVFEDWAVQSQYITGSWLHGNPTAWEQFSKQFDNKLANTEIKQALSSTEQGEGK